MKSPTVDRELLHFILHHPLVLLASVQMGMYMGSKYKMQGVAEWNAACALPQQGCSELLFLLQCELVRGKAIFAEEILQMRGKGGRMLVTQREGMDIDAFPYVVPWTGTNSQLTSSHSESEVMTLHRRQ